MPQAVRSAAFIILLVLLGFAAPAGAQDSRAAAERAGQFVQDLAGRVVTILARTDTTDAQLREQVEALIRECVDIETIGRSSLGSAWQRATDAQRQDYQGLFSVWAARTYAQRLGATRGGKLTVLGTMATASDAYVRTRVSRADGRSSTLDLRVRDSQGRMKIVDAEVDGVSMDMTQRDEFASVVRRQGLDALIASLRTQVQNTP